jgi:hypothetical protein
VRTTVEIDDELLGALKELARLQGVTLGQAISALTRRSLAEHGSLEVRNGVRLFASKASHEKSDLSIVNGLRDET